MPNAALSHLSRARRVTYAALGAVAVTFLLVQYEQARMRAQVATSRQIARLAREVGGLSVDRESGIRGYRLTRNPVFLEPEVAARGSLSTKFDTLRAYTRTDPAHERPVAALEEAIDAWSSGYAEPLLAAVGTGLTAPDLPSESAGKLRFDRVRAALEDFVEAEERLYAGRVARQRTVAYVGFGALALELIFLAAMCRWHYRRTGLQTIQLVEQQSQMEEQALELEMQAQEAQETLSLVDMIVERMPNGLAILTASGRVERANAALAELLGAPPERLVGTGIANAFGAHGDVVGAALQRVVETGDPETNLPIAEPENGTRARSWLVSIYPIDGQRGAQTYGCIVVDRSGQAHLEQQFLQAQKLEAVGRLAGGVAHDFNNILLAIGATCELLAADAAPDSPMHADLQEVIRTVRRGGGLTRQLLAFTRQQVLRPVVLDLNDSIREVSPMLGRLLGADIAIRTALSNDLHLVEVDPTQVQQILMNLAVNARDAMPGGGMLVLETANVELDEAYARDHQPLTPGDYAMLAVTDTGTGMDSSTLAQLFEPFFTTKDQGKGTGLGLSTVYGIVRQSGGYIWAYSEPGHGATFKIYLPASKRGAANTAAPAPAPATTVPAAPVSGTLLLVEDDVVVRTAMERALTATGYDVLVAGNGHEALELVRSSEAPIDLVVSDMVMPGMGGRALVTELRRLPRPPQVLLMSGYTRDSAIQLSMVDPDAGFLEKPFTLQTLRARVSELLEAQRD